MGLAFVEQVELLCDVHSILPNQKGRDHCISIMAVLAKNERELLTADLAPVEAENGLRETSSRSAA